MPYHPMVMRLAAYGAPDAVADWREHVTRTPGLVQLRGPVTAIKLARVRVDMFSGTSSTALANVVALAVTGVDLLAQMQDENRARSWVHIRDGKVTVLDHPGGASTGYLLSHGGKFRHADTHARSWPTAAEAMAADISTMSTFRRRYITFDLDHVWTPITDPAPARTTWHGGALDVTDLELGRFLSIHGRASQFAWEPWTVDALAQWLDHSRSRACEVPERVAAAAGLPAEALAPLLEARREPASQVITIVRTLTAQGITLDEMASVLPALLE